MAHMRSEFETKVLDLLDSYDTANWSSDVGTIKMVFKAMWSCSLPLNRINLIAVAMVGFAEGTDLNLEPTLKKMVKAKVMRSFKSKGVIRYELNI